MQAFTVKDLKKFTALLFTQDAFDRFLLHDPSFGTAYHTEISGAKNRAFYPESEQEEAMKVPFVTWGEVRPLARELLRGSRPPVRFRVVLLTDPASTESMVRRSGFTGCPVTSLSLTIQYREQAVTLTSGVSYGGFSADKSLEKYWARAVMQFLDAKQVAYEEA